MNFTCEEYAKYIIDNMGRAQLSNALTITTKFDVDNGYKFTDILINIQKYLDKLIIEDKFDKMKCYKLLVIVSNTLNDLNNSKNINKIYIYNDFIINIWKVFNGY